MESKILKLRRKKESSYTTGNYDSSYKHCIEIAELLVENEKYEDALLEYKEAVCVGKMYNNQMDIARANRMIAEVYVMMQKPKDAIEFVRKFLEISRKERDLKEEQRALATLARIYFIIAEDVLPSSTERQDALVQAQTYNIKSLKICDKLEEEGGASAKNIGEMRARVYLNLGLVEEALAKLEKAVQYLGKAVIICKSLDLWEELCLSYTNLGLAHKHSEDFASALKAFDLGLSVACRLSDKEKYLSDIYVQKAQVLAAICEFEEKLILLPENDISERRKMYEMMGDGCAALESYKKALEYYHLTLECSEKLGESGKRLSDILVSLAQTYKDVKDFDKAIEYYNRELTVWKDNPAEACNTSISIAEALELNHASSREILTMYRSALCLARDAKNIKLERIVLKNMRDHLEDNSNSVMASEIEKELEKVEKQLDGQSESEDESEDTPAIGDHICLDTLSDSEADEEEMKLKPRTARRVRGGFQLRRNEKGETPLHVACINGNLTLVTKLLDQGHPLDVRDNNGWTPLHEAANHGYVEIAQELVERGAAINDAGGPHCDGVTPLLDAASCGHFRLMDMLLQKGASPIARTDKGETVLDCLTNWRRRFIEEEQTDLTGEMLNDYNTIARKIKFGYHQSRTSSPLVRRRKSSEGSPETRSHTNNSSNNRAVSEYQSAIRGLKHRSNVNSEVPISPIKLSQGALVNAENAIDDWLIDDLNEDLTSRPLKRRKRDDTFSGVQLRKSSNKEKSKNSKPSLRSTIEYSDSETCDSNGTNHCADDDDFSSKEEQNDRPSEMSEDALHMDDDNNSANMCDNHISSLHSIDLCDQPSPSINRLSSTQMRQTTLLDAGIHREPVQIAQDLVSPPAQTPVDITSRKRQTVKVRIEGKLMLIPLPIDPDLTMSWLEEETARRYNSMEGVEPKLSLQTADGALIHPHDSLSLIADLGSEINAIVTSWNLAPIKDRYRRACTANNIDVISEVEARLDSSQITKCLDLENFTLFTDEFTPIFKSLAHHKSLQYLRLSTNCLGDSGLQALMNTLVDIPELKELDLSCCNITHYGLDHMCQFILQKNLFEALEVIDMSHNRLGDDCLRHVCNLVSKLPNLHTLKLRSVSLTSFKAQQDFYLDQIEVLDLSSNDIGREGMLDILSKLNPGRIRRLELADVGSEWVAREVAIFLGQCVPYNLEHLDLSYCDIDDLQMNLLLKSLKMCPKLRNLQLEGNSKLSPCMVQRLCELELTHLNLAGVPCNLRFIKHDIENLYISTVQKDLSNRENRRRPFGFYSNNLNSVFR
ncbi:tonsoku-like protein [Nilaparvata lugens]|uniref:tonsoku-like protein n=1 Tax=Nilaparvata lugens TaxID=108931 RepID=UPI00193D5053|nr:tonsoku-like protein [Nilaparvata lugens]